MQLEQLYYYRQWHR